MHKDLFHWWIIWLLGSNQVQIVSFPEIVTYFSLSFCCVQAFCLNMTCLYRDERVFTGSQVKFNTFKRLRMQTCHQTEEQWRHFAIQEQTDTFTQRQCVQFHLKLLLYEFGTNFFCIFCWVTLNTFPPNRFKAS